MSILDAPIPNPLKVLPYPGGDAAYGQSVAVPGSPFSAAAAGFLFDVDCSGFGSLELDITGVFTGQAFSVEETVDGSTWYAIPMTRVTDFVPTVGISFSGSGSRVSVELGGQRVRARLTTIASGAFSVAACLHVSRRARPTVYVGGQASDGIALSGAPVRIGARAVTAMPTALANAQSADLLSSADRKLLVLNDSIPETTWAYAAVSGGIVDTTPVAIKVATAGLRNYLRSIQLANNSAVASEVTVSDGTTIIWRGFLGANQGNASVVFSPPLRGTVNTALNVAVLTTATKTYVNAQGYFAS